LDEIQSHILLKRWWKACLERHVGLAKDTAGQFLIDTDLMLEVRGLASICPEPL
jgi:hypothetical protein